MNLRHTHAALGAALVLGAVQVFAQGQAPQDPSRPPQATQQDRKFLADVAQANLAEIAVSNLALTKDVSASVKQLAQMMVDDHTKAQDEVKQLAGPAEATLPTMPDARHQTEASKLNNLNGAAFESRYLNDLKKDHADAILTFKHEVLKGTHAAVKAFAEKTLPTLKHHAEMVKQARGGR